MSEREGEWQEWMGCTQCRAEAPETRCSRAKGAGSHSQEENGAVLLEQAQPGEEAEVAGEGEVWAVRGGR